MARTLHFLTGMPQKGPSITRSRGPAVMVAAAGGLATWPAVAQPVAAAPIELSWSAPGECPDEGFMRAEVARLTRSPVGGGAPLRVRASVSSDEPGRWRLELRTTRGGLDASRSLEGPACAPLADAAALIISMMVDPDAEPAATPEAAAPTPAVADTGPDGRDDPQRPRAETPAPPPAEAPRRRRARGVRPAAAPPTARTPLRFVVGAGAGVDVALLPGASLSVRAAAGIVVGPWRVELSGQYWPGNGVVHPTRPDVGGRFSLAAGGATVCRDLAAGQVAGVGLCAGVEAGAVTGTSYGVTAPATASAPWAAATVSAAGALRVASRVALRVQAAAVVPVLRPDYQLENLGTVHRLPAVGFRGLFGVEVHF